MLAIFPETLSYVEKGMVEHIAVSTRKTYQKKIAPKLDLKELVKAMGIRLESTRYHSLAALVAQDNQGRFTVSMIISDRIFQNGGDQESFQFLLAHMLGHYLIHLQPMIARGELDSLGYRENLCPHKRYVSGGTDPNGSSVVQQNSLDLKRELECDQFAAALLLPKGMILHAFKKLQNQEKLAAIFGVSKGCLVRRLEDLGALSRSPQSFLEAESSLQPKPQQQDRLADLVAPSFEKPLQHPIGTIRRQESSKPKIENPEERVSSKASGEPQGQHQTGLKGMARIREIAKMLDKNQS